LIIYRKLELAGCRGDPVTEQGDRFKLAYLINRHRRVGLGNRERGHRIDEFSVAAERLTACGQHSDAWRAMENRAHNPRARVQQMLAIVEHEEQFLIRQVVDQ